METRKSFWPMTPAESYIASKSPEWEQVVVCRWQGAHRSPARISGLVLLWLDYGFTPAMVCFPRRNLRLPKSSEPPLRDGSEGSCKGCWTWAQQTEHLEPRVIETVFWTHRKGAHFTEGYFQCPGSVCLSLHREV